MSINRSMANLIDGSGNLIDGGLSVYPTLNNLPTTNLSSGDQAYVTENSRMYVSNGSGWYNVALINATPTLTISPSGSIELAKDGTTTTTITLTGADSDNADANLTYSVESDGNFGGFATISQDSSVFTITPLSEDSATTTSSTLTFKASDGISFGTGTSVLSLTFKVANSTHTSFLLQADATRTDNQVDASTNAHTITENGVRSTSLTPYHPGGYSWGWAGNGTDYFTINSPTSALSFGTGDFCIEMWIYPFDVSSAILVDMRPDETNGNYIGAYGLSSGNLALGHNGVGGTSSGRVTSGTPVVAYKWNHIVVNRESGNLNMFVNGVRGFTTTTVYTFNVGKFRLFKNAYSAGGVSDGSGGWLRDYRVVKGSSVYGYGSTYTVPTEPLTAITGTSLLLFGKAYRHDAVGTETVSYISGHFDRNGPYNYPAYKTNEHGGSVYFDGNDDLDLDFNAIGTSDFTIECWVYIDDSTAHQVICDFRPTSTDNTTGLNLQFRSNNVAYVGTFGTGLITGTSVMADYSWNHIAVTRSGSTLTLWVNGTSQGTASHSVNLTSTDMKIGTNRTGVSPYNGNISDFRLVKSAVYTTAFSPPTAPLTAIANTEILTCTNKNDIWDATSARNNMITRNGNVVASNTQRQFTGSSAVYFDGTGDYLDFEKRDEYQFESGIDFTVEGWWYMVSISRPLISMGTGVDASPAHYSDWNLYYNGSGNLNWYAYSNGGSVLRQFAWTPSTATWYHIAVTRSGTDMKAFVNGTQVGTTLTDSTSWKGYSGTRPLRVGRFIYGGGTSAYLNGYAQDIRITKGLARYTANFTAPTGLFGG